MGFFLFVRFFIFYKRLRRATAASIVCFPEFCQTVLSDKENLSDRLVKSTSSVHRWGLSIRRSKPTDKQSLCTTSNVGVVQHVIYTHERTSRRLWSPLLHALKTIHVMLMC